MIRLQDALTQEVGGFWELSTVFDSLNKRQLYAEQPCLDFAGEDVFGAKADNQGPHTVLALPQYAGYGND